ncbi:MAG: helix-turn-helix domain-containing protein [Burkholderiales bacterium]
MRDLIVVWVDLRTNAHDPSPVPVAAAGLRLACVRTSSAIDDVLAAVTERGVLCFEFDTPDRPGLLALAAAKVRRPSMPILMLTESHSESLAVWALRARVWDYLVAPVGVDGLRERLRALDTIADAMCGRVNACPVPPLPPEVQVRARRIATATRAAHEYLQAHFNEPLGTRKMAERCHLSTSEFCRAYKREHGIPFGESVLRQRVAAARELLGSPQAVISDVACAVGFNDPSYFSRVFRRFTGMSASAYRLACLTRGRVPEGSGPVLHGLAIGGEIG